MRILIILKIVFLTAGKKESLRNSHEILAQGNNIRGEYLNTSSSL